MGGAHASANFHRRHLNRKQRQEFAIDLIASRPERSDRQIAKDLGVDHHQIARARAKGEDVGRVSHVATRTDIKGRQQPASKPARARPPAPPPTSPAETGTTPALLKGQEASSSTSSCAT
jgi:hypothetical protein